MATVRPGARLFSLLLAAALLTPPAAAGVREWTRIGPFGGRPRSVVFHPANPDVAYAVGWAGLYVSTDRGATWKIVPAFGPNETVSLLAISERPPYSLFVYTRIGSSGRLLQLNPDLTCCVAPASFSGYASAITIARGNPEVLLVASGKSVYRKVLEGASGWQRSDLPFEVSLLEAAADASGYVFVAGYERDGLRSTDRGATWAPMALPMRANAIKHVKDGIVYLTGMGAGGLCAGPSDSLFQSWDYGDKWYWANAGLSANDRDCYPNTTWIECLPQTCYLSGDNKVFSRDEGQIRWVPRPDLPFFRMWVRTDGALLLGGDFVSFWRSLGGPWGDASTGLAEAQVNAILVDGEGEIRYALGPAALFEHTASLGWTLQSFRINAEAFPSLTAGYALVRKQTGEWALRAPGALEWSTIPGTSAFTAMARGSSGALYGIFLDANKFRFQVSDNGGTNWRTLSTLVPQTIWWPHRTAIYTDPFNGSHLFLRSHDDVLESTDGGKNWTTIRTGSYLSEIEVDWRGAKVYVVESFKLYARSFAGGEWTPLLPNVIGLAVETSTGTLYATTSNRGLLRSGDGGASWATVDSATFDRELVATENGVAVATATGVWTYDFPGSRRRAVRK